MEYCSQEDIAGQILGELLVQLTDGTDNTPDSAIIDAQIVKAREEMEPYIASVLKLPLTTIPGSVNAACVKITVYRLYARVASRVGAIPENIRKDYESAISFLKDVAAGRAVIGEQNKPPALVPIVKSNPRRFSQESMKGL